MAAPLRWVAAREARIGDADEGGRSASEGDRTPMHDDRIHPSSMRDARGAAADTTQQESCCVGEEKLWDE
jgi:hypothetical protein